MTSRIYIVIHGNDTHLVNASNKATAINHVVRNSVKASVASQLELVELLSSGTEVQKAGKDSES